MYLDSIIERSKSHKSGNMERSMEQYNVEQIISAVAKTYNQLNFDKFVETILKTKPNIGDIWQREKWYLYQDMCIALLRISPEMFEQILTFGAEHHGGTHAD